MGHESEYTIGFDDFDVSLLPVAARTPGSPEFVEAFTALVAKAKAALPANTPLPLKPTTA